MSLIHYIFVRRDLPLGIMAAMITHAAGDSASQRMWPLPPHTIAVVLEAKDEEHLKDISGYLRANCLEEGVDKFSVFESGGPYDGQLMAIGLLPQERDALSNKLKEFQTLKSCLDNPKEGA